MHSLCQCVYNVNITMPKKTRKEKIIAQYRKKLKLLNQQNNQSLIENKLLEKKPEIKKIEKNNNLNKNNSSDNKYFVNDLKKSLIITFLIIALEISLYFANLIK